MRNPYFLLNVAMITGMISESSSENEYTMTSTTAQINTKKRGGGVGEVDSGDDNDAICREIHRSEQSALGLDFWRLDGDHQRRRRWIGGDGSQAGSLRRDDRNILHGFGLSPRADFDFYRDSRDRLTLLLFTHASGT